MGLYACSGSVCITQCTQIVGIGSEERFHTRSHKFDGRQVLTVDTWFDHHNNLLTTTFHEVRGLKFLQQNIQHERGGKIDATPQTGFDPRTINNVTILSPVTRTGVAPTDFPVFDCFCCCALF